jgi:adenylosuccinate synthase
LLNIADIGKEYGVTTGRRRKVNWLNLDLLIKAANISGATTIIINKVDILMQANTFRLFHEGVLKRFEDYISFKRYVEHFLKSSDNHIEEIIFSKHPEII